MGLTSQEERGQVAIPIDNLITGEWEVVGSKGDSHANYDELLPLVARGKRNPARLVTRQIALRDVTDTLQRMTRFGDGAGRSAPSRPPHASRRRAGRWPSRPCPPSP